MRSEDVITVYAYGLTVEQADALFDRVADAAHELDEQVTVGASRREQVGA
jgi:hypothetical protein